jgi:hypothetical protein
MKSLLCREFDFSMVISLYNSSTISQSISQSINQTVTKQINIKSVHDINQLIKCPLTSVVAVFAGVTVSAVQCGGQAQRVGVCAVWTGGGYARRLRTVVTHWTDEVLGLVGGQLTVKPKHTQRIH